MAFKFTARPPAPPSSTIFREKVILAHQKSGIFCKMEIPVVSPKVAESTGFENFTPLTPRGATF